MVGSDIACDTSLHRIDPGSERRARTPSSNPPRHHQRGHHPVRFTMPRPALTQVIPLSGSHRHGNRDEAARALSRYKLSSTKKVSVVCFWCISGLMSAFTRAIASPVLSEHVFLAGFCSVIDDFSELWVAIPLISSPACAMQFWFYDRVHRLSRCLILRGLLDRDVWV